MSIERALLKTALKVLEGFEWGYGGDDHKSPEADILYNIRELLAKPEQEPVAWMFEECMFTTTEWSRMAYTGDIPWYHTADTGERPCENSCRRNIQPLYTSPPQRQFRDDEMADPAHDRFFGGCLNKHIT